MEFVTYTKSLDTSSLLKYNIFISPIANISEGVKLYNGVKVYGESIVGKDVELHSNVEINNSKIGDFCKIFCSTIEDCDIAEYCTIKPFTHITNTQIGECCVIGNFACIKDSVIGEKAKISCLVNLNKVDAGSHLNIGSGVCCEVDGEDNIVIGDNVKFGANTTIIKSVVIADNTRTKPNSVVLKNILD